MLFKSKFLKLYCRNLNINVGLCCEKWLNERVFLGIRVIGDKFGVKKCFEFRYEDVFLFFGVLSNV